MRNLIVLFAKAPIPGRVKTRLIPRFGPAGASRLHCALVEDLWRLTLEPLTGIADRMLATDTPAEAWPDLLPRTLQRGADLGERLLTALSDGLAAGYHRVVIVGGDVPGLPPSHLKQLLGRPEDVALGPTPDGGYYAIGASRTQTGMFAGVRWSTRFAFQDTVEACRGCGLSVAAGPPWWDLDTPEDFDLLPESVRLALAARV